MGETGSYHLTVSSDPAASMDRMEERTELELSLLGRSVGTEFPHFIYLFFLNKNIHEL